MYNVLYMYKDHYKFAFFVNFENFLGKVCLKMDKLLNLMLHEPSLLKLVHQV